VLTSKWRSWAEPISLVGLFAYVFWFRVHGLEEDFVLKGDQLRDWDVVLRGVAGLPLGGVPSSAGGATVGPAYYWILWFIARLVGPAFDYLPHAGGLGISLLQSLSDIVLAWALRRRTGSLTVALAVVLLPASSVRDAVFSSTIWNPPVAEALLKLAIASVLADGGQSRAAAAFIALTAWAAVQCHTAGVLVAAPLLTWMAIAPALAGQRRASAVRVAVIIAVVAALQVPWVVKAMSVGAQGQTQVGESLLEVVQSPATALRPLASADALSTNLEGLLATPMVVPFFGVALVVGGGLLIALARDTRLAVCGPVPLLASIGAFALWQGPTFEQYWYLVCLPPAAITLLAWVGFVPSPARRVAGLLVLAAMVAVQPARIPLVRTMAPYPGYGAMVRGCRQIVADDRPVATVVAPGPLMTAVDPLWLCSILNIRLEPDAMDVAVIDLASGGTVSYRARQ
jgi:hypothetical protein